MEYVLGKIVFYSFKEFVLEIKMGIMKYFQDNIDNGDNIKQLYIPLRDFLWSKLHYNLRTQLYWYMWYKLIDKSFYNNIMRNYL